MARNYLVTGPPRSGKTTVVERFVDRVRDRGFDVGGVASPERRADGERVGFDVVDVATGESRELASVDRERGPRVGKYRVAVSNVDSVATAAITHARERADVAVVDEIAPMQLHGDGFVRAVRGALDGDTPVVAAIKAGETPPVIGAFKSRSDATVVEVTQETRDDLPATLESRVLDGLGDGEWG